MGLSLESEVALPGLLPWQPTGPRDIRLKHGDVPTALECPTASGTNWQLDGDHFLFELKGIARFLLTRGQDVSVAIDSQSSPEEAAPYISGTVLGALMHQRQRVVLHASAVEIAGKALLFCGDSGVGKSTLAAALGQAGHRLLNDDLCAIDFDAIGGPMVHSDGRLLKLWSNAIDHLELDDRRGPAVLSQSDKFYVDPATLPSELAIPLGMIYQLRDPSPASPAGIERVTGIDAALLIVRNAYRPRIAQQMGRRDSYFRAAVAIAKHAGCSLLSRPLDLATLPEVVGWIEAQWQQ